MREQAIFADYFLICEAENERQLRALAQSIRQSAKHDAQVRTGSQEGIAESGWVLVDFGDLIVHIFSPKMRHYYNLEDLWDEAQIVLHMQ